jgi:hypothetical protein
MHQTWQPTSSAAAAGFASDAQLLLMPLPQLLALLLLLLPLSLLYQMHNCYC